ncbi:MAG: spore cortex-lytic enzyme [Firmicutes bacterium]|nr:spore cortex-lytic enzyme [Bacillota bacterium]
MLNGIRENILSKFICGLVLVSVTLSYFVGILRLSSPNLDRKPVKSITKKLTKPSNTQKKEGVNLNPGITTNKEVNNSDWEETNPVWHNVTKSEPNTNYSAVTNDPKTNKPVANSLGQTEVQKPGPQSEVDLYLLARVIYAESRGEPIQGQVAVGAVLLNRLKDKRFPKNLSQIIFKKGEFCTVRDGQIWKTPDQEAIKAARLAVAGWDPTDGALYFYNPAKTTSRWIWSRPVVNKIGNHIFAI